MVPRCHSIICVIFPPVMCERISLFKMPPLKLLEMFQHYLRSLTSVCLCPTPLSFTLYYPTLARVSFRKFSKGGATGGIWILKGGMMVKDVTKFHNCLLAGRDILECVCVQGFIQDFEVLEGGKL